MSAARVGVDAVNRRDVAGRAVDVQHRSAEFLFHVRAHGAGTIAADQQILAVHHGPVHGIVHDQTDQVSVRALEANQVHLPVYGTVGVQSERYFSIDVLCPAVDIGHGDGGVESDARGFEPFAGATDRVHQGLGH